MNKIFSMLALSSLTNSLTLLSVLNLLFIFSSSDNTVLYTDISLNSTSAIKPRNSCFITALSNCPIKWTGIKVLYYIRFDF